MNLIKNQPDIDKIYFYAKDPYETKYQYVIIKTEGVGIGRFNDPKAFIEYSNAMYDVYQIINYYNIDKENKILKVFDDMIANMINNKKQNSVVTELFIRERKSNISLVFITQSFFKVPKDVRLNTTHFLSQKFQIEESLRILHENIRSILKLKISLISIENVQLNHLLFSLMILPFHQIIVKGWENFFLTYIIKIMTINDQIRDEKLQYDINREAAKISAWSSGKVRKYEYLTGEDILPSTQQQMIEQARFTYSPSGKAFEKQIKTIEDQRQKQVEALNILRSNNQ